MPGTHVRRVEFVSLAPVVKIRHRRVSRERYNIVHNQNWGCGTISRLRLSLVQNLEITEEKNSKIVRQAFKKKRIEFKTIFKPKHSVKQL